MFPIPWNFPFRKKDGSIGKIEDLGGDYNLPTASANTKGGVKIGSRLTMTGEVLSADAQVPAYSSAEAGKVLTVGEEGELEWNEAGGAGGVYVGTTPPDSSLGSDGEYYYKRSLNVDWLTDAKFSTSTSQPGYGNEFVIVAPIKLTKIKAKMTSNVSGKLVIGDLTQIFEEHDNLSFIANEWLEVTLNSPLNLSANDHIIVKVYISTSTSYNVGDVLSSYDGNTNVATYVKAYYGSGYPGNSENGAKAPVSFVFENDYYTVEEQYYKKNGTWNQIA